MISYIFGLQVTLMVCIKDCKYSLFIHFNIINKWLTGYLQFVIRLRFIMKHQLWMLFCINLGQIRFSPIIYFHFITIIIIFFYCFWNKIQQFCRVLYDRLKTSLSQEDEDRELINHLICKTILSGDSAKIIMFSCIRDLQ